MNEFYISKVVAKGSGKTDSFVELQPGLNIIQGRSNTGKTCIIKCIDFCFGSKAKPFDESLGYKVIEIHLSTPNGNIQISRTFGKNKVEVVTDVPGYNSGTYDLKLNTKKKEPTPVLSDLLLASIGINDEHFIIKNKFFEKQRLTWRTLLPLLLFHVSDITKETSVIEPTQGTEKTAFLSALLLLLTGQDFADVDPKTKKEIRVARKKAVEDYVNKKIAETSDKKKLLEEQFALFDGIDVEQKMQEIIDDIEKTEQKISAATAQSKEILSQIISLQENSAECSLLQSRYSSLRSQYVSDIKRLSFIVNGEVELNKVTHNTVCPFCEGTIPVKNQKSYIESAQAELNRITRQMNGLLETENELALEKEEINNNLKVLEQQRADIEKLLQEELQPKAEILRKAHNDYCTYIKIQHELNVIAAFATSWETDLRELPSEEESDSEYHPKEYFDKAFQEKLDSLLKDALTECSFPNLTTARFNITSFDVEINGHKKQNFQGQGYSSFLNSIIAMSFRQYLSSTAVYDPGFLVIDTPLLGLDQGVSDVSPESMRTSLYAYFMNHQDCGQVILLENITNVPDIDFKASGVNVITFTKGLEDGRYGFLIDVRD
ncbi:MAG: AAA family ATPase [Anaerotignum sp.]|uniref:AAA family ATPase n=1 Tax=Anaerotignum sp. TaxID=2039241 RepID=UPI0039925DA5